MGDRPLFSYSSTDDPALRRIAIQTIERLTGQPRLKRMYLSNQRRPRQGESFWDAAVRQLELDINYDPERLRRIPAGDRWWSSPTTRSGCSTASWSAI